MTTLIILSLMIITFTTLIMISLCKDFINEMIAFMFFVMSFLGAIGSLTLFGAHLKGMF